MAKYMDLLREHQTRDHQGEQEGPDGLAADAKSAAENNAMVTDEAEQSSAATAGAATLSDSEMLADETEHEHDGDSLTAVTSAMHSQTATDSNTSDWLTRTCQEATKLFKAANQNSPADIYPLIEQLNSFIERLPDNQQLIDALELEVSNREKQISTLDPDLGSLIQKSIMMMLYAIKMGQRLQLNTDELRSHILAAMIHHIGMAQISSEIRHKKEKLSKDEIKEIRTAPKKSHDYLTLCGITDAAILQAATQAQERFDGSGPKELTGSNIAYSARIVGLLSIFESLIHYRPYRNRLLPRDAIRELVNHHKKAFDPKLLKALIESISLYPVGTYVQLNSGDVGLVIQVHPRLPLRPVVRIMLDNQGDSILQRDIDLKLQPNLMVQRCMYEEGLLELKDAANQAAAH